MNDPFRVESVGAYRFPGLWPGLTETTFQVGKQRAVATLPRRITSQIDQTAASTLCYMPSFLEAIVFLAAHLAIDFISSHEVF